jgi:hypothetical protein
MVDLGERVVEVNVRSLQLVIRFELGGGRGLDDVVDEKFQLFVQVRVTGNGWSLALQGSDGVGDEGF